MKTSGRRMEPKNLSHGRLFLDINTPAVSLFCGNWSPNWLPPGTEKFLSLNTTELSKNGFGYK